MTYMDESEADLRTILEGDHDLEAEIAFVKAKLLESYKNGIAVGARRAASKKVKDE